MTPATNPASTPSWKEEVNRRIAEHRCRKPASTAERISAVDVASSMSRRAQEAAARVAARYANAPSFGEALASEAREALRVAEEASRTATEARKVAESVLANLRAVTAAAARPLAPVVVLPNQHAAPLSARDSAAATRRNSIDPVSIRMAPAEPEPLPAQLDAIEIESIKAAAAPALPPSADRIIFQPAQPVQPPPSPNLFQEEWWKLPELEPAQPAAVGAAEPEPPPLQASVLDAPRELVATRRVRPRIAEGPLAGVGLSPQLSIFEVSPISISTEPEPAAANWAQPNWPRIETDPLPAEIIDALEEPAPRPRPAHVIEPAFLGRRFMAFLMDGMLVSAATLGALGAALVRDSELPSLRTLGLGVTAALAVIVLFYLALFLTLAEATPGMKYAHLRFTSFDGLAPTRAQRFKRLSALLLSVLPLGLGFAWSLFDEDRLCWHDRFSRTYLAHR